MNNYYNKLTVDTLLKALTELNNKKMKRSNPYVIYCGFKTAKVMDITYKEYLGLLSAEEANLKRYAAYNDAYIHPEWDYLKYPSANLCNPYTGSFTNEIFEDGEEDIYGGCELIYIGRK